MLERPIRITIPYAEADIPPDRTEAELYAVFYHDGGWQRMDGVVDPVANTITVESFHASLWTWAADTWDNAVDAIRQFLYGEAGCELPQTVAEAEDLVERAARRVLAGGWRRQLSA